MKTKRNKGIRLRSFKTNFHLRTRLRCDRSTRQEIRVEDAGGKDIISILGVKSCAKWSRYLAMWIKNPLSPKLG
jgi:hypothetical protein